MKRLIFGIILGVCLGLYLSSKKSPEPSVDSTAVHESEIAAPQVDQPKTGRAVTFVDRSRVVKEVKTAVAPASALVAEKMSPEATTQQLLSLDISEQQITAMEETLPELQREVSLFKDRTGWVVRFHKDDNLFAQVGVRDNDLIRYGLLERFKNDPAKTDLISRLEVVMENLQR